MSCTENHCAERHQLKDQITVAFREPIKPICKSGFITMGSGPAPWRKHILAHQRPVMAVLFSLLGAGLFEPTLENEGSISGSDSTFYRQSEGEVTLRTATGKWEGWKGCGVYRQMGHERAGEAVGLMSCDHNHVVIDQRELKNWEIIVKPGTNTSCVKLLL